MARGVALRAASLLHHGREQAARFEDRVAGGVQRVVPGAVVVAVGIHPGEDQVAFGARHFGMLFDQDLGQRRRPGADGSRRQELERVNAGVVAIQEAGEPVLDERFVADVKRPGPAAGEVEACPHALFAAVPNHQMAIAHPGIKLHSVSSQLAV